MSRPKVDVWTSLPEDKQPSGVNISVSTFHGEWQAGVEETLFLHAIKVSTNPTFRSEINRIVGEALGMSVIEELTFPLLSNNVLFRRLSTANRPDAYFTLWSTNKNPFNTESLSTSLPIKESKIMETPILPSRVFKLFSSQQSDDWGKFIIPKRTALYIPSGKTGLTDVIKQRSLEQSRLYFGSQENNGNLDARAAITLSSDTLVGTEVLNLRIGYQEIVLLSLLNRHLLESELAIGRTLYTIKFFEVYRKPQAWQLAPYIVPATNNPSPESPKNLLYACIADFSSNQP